MLIYYARAVLILYSLMSILCLILCKLVFILLHLNVHFVPKYWADFSANKSARKHCITNKLVQYLPIHLLSQAQKYNQINNSTTNESYFIHQNKQRNNTINKLIITGTKTTKTDLRWKLRHSLIRFTDSSSSLAILFFPSSNSNWFNLMSSPDIICFDLL